MPGVSTEDEFRMLYYISKLVGRPRMDDIAASMGLKKDACAWRYKKLMKRLEADFGSTAPVAAAAAAPKTVKKTKGATKKTTQAIKRKQEDFDSEDKLSNDYGKNKTSKKAKVDPGEIEDDTAVEAENATAAANTRAKG